LTKNNSINSPVLSVIQLKTKSSHKCTQTQVISKSLFVLTLFRSGGNVNDHLIRRSHWTSMFYHVCNVLMYCTPNATTFSGFNNNKRACFVATCCRVCQWKNNWTSVNI